MKSIDTLEYIEFGVLINAEKVDTKLINETLLRRSKIIQDSDETELNSIIVTPIHSRIKFKNGLEIQADQNRLQFTQQSDFSAGGENRCPNIAVDFFENLQLRVPVTSVSIIFKAVIPSSIDEPKSKNTAHFFVNHANWAAWNGCLPRLCFQAIYRRKNMTVILDVGTATKSDDESTTGELYEANFHRKILTSSAGLNHSILCDILMAWNTDLDDFKNLISNFRNA